jgi:hypothetical protein
MHLASALLDSIDAFFALINALLASAPKASMGESTN